MHRQRARRDIHRQDRLELDRPAPAPHGERVGRGRRLRHGIDGRRLLLRMPAEAAPPRRDVRRQAPALPPGLGGVVGEAESRGHLPIREPRAVEREACFLLFASECVSSKLVAH